MANRRRSNNNPTSFLFIRLFFLHRFRSQENSVIGQRSSQPRNTKGESIRVMPPPLLPTVPSELPLKAEHPFYIQLSSTRLLLLINPPTRSSRPRPLSPPSRDHGGGGGDGGGGGGGDDDNDEDDSNDTTTRR